MGKAKAWLMELMETDEGLRLAFEAEEDRRQEPVLPDTLPVTEGQDAQGQEGENYPFIFEQRGNYATSISV